MDSHLVMLTHGVGLARDIAEDIVDYAVQDSPEAEYDREILKAMRGSYTIRTEALHDFGSPDDVKALRKELSRFGIKLTEKGVGIDVIRKGQGVLNMVDRFSTRTKGFRKYLKRIV